ncbi:serine hydrolase [Roseicyclus sp. F158]|uniref:Serine hydrolase n=1 Tax=Tropicimonas omnivorans TaxID=3075590 RepID=A0ABU3DG44_9RHOB|nr:serine hydrolase [Roseicyclus sp. F158]MDT0682686.1 serine hydrolase [Roseicyclus sp. F158]
MHRRTALLAGGAALVLPGPLLAQGAGGWDGVIAAARELDQFRAIVVRQGGEEVLAEAISGPGPDVPVNVKSVSKSVVAALLGAVIGSGEVGSVDVTLGEVMPALIPAGAAPAVPGITLEDLVTLRAGLERTSGANYGGWVSSSNWVADALGREMVAEPGGQMLYSTGSFHVLGAALTEATGQSLLALARSRLGDPLGIEIPAWTRDPQGYYLGGNEMALSPRAMVRIGETYRQGGMYDGTRILPRDYIDASLRPRGRSPFSGLSYGYGWFLGQIDGRDFALARGYGGQVIFVMPALELTVAITSDPTRPARSGGYFGDLMDLIERRIVPAAA